MKILADRILYGGNLMYSCYLHVRHGFIEIHVCILGNSLDVCCTSLLIVFGDT